MPIDFFKHIVKDAKGNDYPLEKLRGQVTLVVNVASRCGFTPQYTQLEDLQKKFASRGFTVLGFPCNQFGSQEPGSNEEIQQFCEMNFGVTFPVLAKIDVNGANTAPLYEDLKKAAPGFLGTKRIKWNFTKFLISKDGRVLKRYSPHTKPSAIEADIAMALKGQL